MKLNRLAAALAAGLMALSTACAQNAPTSGASGTTPKAASETASTDATPAGKITLTHKAGTTELDGPAQRIVVLDLGALDTLRALGMSDKVVGVAKGTKLPKALEEFNDAKYADVGALKEPNLEAIAQLNPDLVIAGFRSSKIAPDLMTKFPTIDVTYDTAGDFFDGVSSAAKLVAQAVGKETEVDAKLAALKKEIDAAKATTDPNAKVLVLMVSGGKVSVVHPQNRFDLIYDNLGMKPAIDKKADDTQAHGDAVSFEAIQQANPDVIYVLDRDAAIGNEGGQAAAQVLDNELMHATTAWKNGKVHYVDGSRWYVMIHGVDNVGEMLKEITKDA